MLFFNDPKVLDAWVKFAEVNPRASGLFLLLLPIPMDSPYCKPGTGAATLKKDMQGKVFDQFVLELLDARVKDAKLNPFDEQILRFLNRYYGYDFDTSLRTSAPMAFEFRKAELRKGYDPLVLYGQLVRSSAVPVVFDEAGLESILPDMVDRISCEQLFNCYYEARGRTSGFPAESDWQPRLVEWYTRARPCLKYDPESGMFVNTASDAGSNGESTGEVDNETTAPYEGPERGEAADQ